MVKASSNVIGGYGGDEAENEYFYDDPRAKHVSCTNKR